MVDLGRLWDEEVSKVLESDEALAAVETGYVTRHELARTLSESVAVEIGQLDQYLDTPQPQLETAGSVVVADSIRKTASLVDRTIENYPLLALLSAAGFFALLIVAVSLVQPPQRVSVYVLRVAWMSLVLLLAIGLVVLRREANRHAIAERATWAGTDHSEVQEDRYRSVIRTARILPRLREYVNLRMQTGHSLTIATRDWRGLGSMYDRAHELPTVALRRVERIIDRLPGATIAVSGSRGSGKTTILRSLCQAQSNGDVQEVRLLVPVPVRYQAREFLLHLYASLCEAVIASSWRAPAWSRRNRVVDENPRSVGTALVWLVGLNLVGIGILNRAAGNRKIGILDLTLFVGLVALGAQGWLLAFVGFRRRVSRLGLSEEAPFWRNRTVPLPRLILSTLLLVTAVLPILSSVTGAASLRTVVRDGLFVIGALTCANVFAHQYMVGRAIRRGYTRPSHENLQQFAQRRLRQIRFQRTVSVSTGMALRVGGKAFTAESASSASETLARVVEGVPEIVASLRDFLAAVGSVTRVVVALDELDKIEPPEEARLLLSEIKGVFGVENCFFLVSVADDALTSIAGVGEEVARGSVDEWVETEPFTVVELRHLLARRVIGFPLSAVALAYSLSGGVPRECMRVARSIMEQCERTGLRDLGSVAQLVVAHEHRMRQLVLLPRAMSAIREDTQSPFWGVIASMREAPLSESTLKEATTLLQRPNGERSLFAESDTPTAVLALIANAHHLLTVAELFEERGLRLAVDRGVIAEDSVDATQLAYGRLATARRLVERSPSLAWRLTSDVRMEWRLPNI